MSSTPNNNDQVSSVVDSGVADAMETLSRLGSELLESYDTLAQRAERVEDELCRTNAELESKVNELDAVNRDLTAILDALPTGVIVRDAQGRIERINDSALSILRAEWDDLVGTSKRALPESDAAPQITGDWEQCEVTLNGERRVLALRRSDVAAGPETRTSGSVEILEDRTELVELSERLHSLDKLAALGNMAGGIAHEIRNPMNAIKGFAALLNGRLEAGSKEHEWSGLIVEGVSESERILSSMLTLARPDGLVPETVDGAELVQAAVELTLTDAVAIGAPSPWKVTTSGTGPTFIGDRIKLRQALRNLIANAFDSQPSGGEVHIAFSVDEGEVRFTVADAGPGVPAELRTRILDPFFTTRAEGTGLGLALVSTIAHLHGGQLDLSPSSGSLGGAVFSLRFPHRNSA